MTSTLENAFKNKNTRNNGNVIGNNNIRNVNHFKSVYKLEPKFIKKESDFPDLLKSNAVLCNNLQNYKNAIQTEIINDVDVNEVAEGCVCLTKGNDNKLVKKYGKQTIQSTTQNYEYTMNDAINYMSINWDKYKSEYIELYGEDEYKKLHSSKPVYEESDSECSEVSECDDNDLVMA